MDIKTIIKCIKLMENSGKQSLSLEEFAKLTNLSIENAKKVLRKLKREGFIRRTRSGRYKASLASKIILKLMENHKKRK